MSTTHTSQADGAVEPFWDWSDRVYRLKGLSEHLIRLQDAFGLDVNLVLWAVWSGVHYGEMPDIAARKALDISRQWAESVVTPLRGARRALKTPPMQADEGAAKELRKKVKKAELEAERLQQEMLERLAAECGSQAKAGDAKTAARRNLANYASLAGVVKTQGFTISELETALDAMLPDADNAEAGPKG